MKKNKIAWALFFLIFFVLLGFYREFFFVHYNNVMYQVYYHTDSHLKTPYWLQFLFHVPYNALYYAKYPLTIFFVLLFLGLNFLAIKKIGTVQSNSRYVIYAYLFMFLIAGFSMAYAYFFTKNLADDEYTLSRWLFGVAQSPIICLFLLASEKLITKAPNHD
jgi:hypothetical protein